MFPSTYAVEWENVPVAGAKDRSHLSSNAGAKATYSSPLADEEWQATDSSWANFPISAGAIDRSHLSSYASAKATDSSPLVDEGWQATDSSWANVPIAAAAKDSSNLSSYISTKATLLADEGWQNLSYSIPLLLEKLSGLTTDPRQKEVVRELETRGLDAQTYVKILKKRAALAELDTELVVKCEGLLQHGNELPELTDLKAKLLEKDELLRLKDERLAKMEEILADDSARLMGVIRWEKEMRQKLKTELASLKVHIETPRHTDTTSHNTSETLKMSQSRSPVAPFRSTPGVPSLENSFSYVRGGSTPLRRKETLALDQPPWVASFHQQLDRFRLEMKSNEGQAENLQKCVKERLLTARASSLGRNWRALNNTGPRSLSANPRPCHILPQHTSVLNPPIALRILPTDVCAAVSVSTSDADISGTDNPVSAREGPLSARLHVAGKDGGEAVSATSNSSPSHIQPAVRPPVSDTPCLPRDAPQISYIPHISPPAEAHPATYGRNGNAVGIGTVAWNRSAFRGDPKNTPNFQQARFSGALQFSRTPAASPTFTPRLTPRMTPRIPYTLSPPERIVRAISTSSRQQLV